MMNAIPSDLWLAVFIIHHSAFIIRLARSQPIGNAPDVAQLAHRLAGCQPFDNLHQRPLAHAEDDQVGFGVEDDRAAYLVAPEVVMGQPAKTGLDAARSS